MILKEEGTGTDKGLGAGARKPCLLEPNGSNTVSGYLRSRPFPTLSGHLLWSPVNSH